MRKFLLVTALFVFSGAALKVHAQEMCQITNDIAKTVMGNRQNGVSMADAMAVSDGNEIIEALIITAYEQPAYVTKEYQERAIKDFADNWYLACVKSMK